MSGRWVRIAVVVSLGCNAILALYIALLSYKVDLIEGVVIKTADNVHGLVVLEEKRPAFGKPVLTLHDLPMMTLD